MSGLPARPGTAGLSRRVPTSAGLAIGALAAAALVAAAVALLPRRGAETVALPPPASAADARAVTAADFAGSASCAECHAPQHVAWRASTHGRAGGPPGPDILIAPFDGRPIRFRDAVVLPRRDAAGNYVFTVARDGRPGMELRVDGVIGGGHMVGGGTQGFVTHATDGTWRFLPFDWSREQGWFCNTATRATRAGSRSPPRCGSPTAATGRRTACSAPRLASPTASSATAAASTSRSPRTAAAGAPRSARSPSTASRATDPGARTSSSRATAGSMTPRTRLSPCSARSTPTRRSPSASSATPSRTRCATATCPATTWPATTA
jgi:hypothetical protein